MGYKDSISPMSEEFHNWLEQCPVQWFRGNIGEDDVQYYFQIKP